MRTAAGIRQLVRETLWTMVKIPIKEHTDICKTIQCQYPTHVDFPLTDLEFG